MPNVVVSTEINATPQEVWDLICDAELYSEWVVATDEVLEHPDGPIEKGAVYREYGGVPPFKSKSVWHVTEFEPIRRQVHIGEDSTIKMPLEVLIEPSGDGTKLTLDIGFNPKWWMTPMFMVMWPLMMGKRARAVMDETRDNFKRLAESRAER